VEETTNKCEQALDEGQSELEALNKELALAKSTLQESENRLVRLMADMDNLRKRTQREKDEIWNIAAADVLVQLLPTLDNFSRAIKVMPQTDWAQGVAMVAKQLDETLQRLGLETINSEGSFDPQFHEAVMQDPNSEQPENTITCEFEKGYLFRGKVLRPSKVRVSTGGESNA